MVRWTAVVLLLVFFLFGNYGFEDVNQALIYYGGKLIPSNINLGIFVFLLIMFLILFTQEIIIIYKKLRKIRLKEKF